MMMTPNGRFQTNTRLCLSISDFHPDLWNPAWSVATILTGLLSFMVETTVTLGSIETPVEVKKQLAIASWSHNLRDRIFTQLFPHLCDEITQKKEEYEKKMAERAARQASLRSTLASSHHSNLVVEHGYCNGVFGNAVLFASLAGFVYIVHYMVTNMV
ncbi:Ubiquitin-conjugating enzyme E2 J2 [Geodia barretti]|nr:Ubiquitin-conjugating enzyme E2 J2 [Geodia barretti]